MSRKYPAIDILKLISGKESQFYDDYQMTTFDDNTAIHESKKGMTSHEKWNEWLTRCLDKNDLEQLIKVRYGLQVGIDDLNKKGLSSQTIVEIWCRWVGSIEKTARRIIKKRYPIPKIDAKMDPDTFAKTFKAKKMLENEFEIFMRKSSF